MLIGATVQLKQQNENFTKPEKGILISKSAGFWYVNINGRTVASYPEDLEEVDDETT